MTTKREQILAAIKAKLTGISGLPDANVFRSRALAFIAGELPALSVTFMTDDPDASRLPQPIIDWRLLVRLDLFIQGDIPDQVADPMISDIHSKIVSDLSLGGLSMDIQPAQVKLELFDGNQPVGNMILHYLVHYRTTQTDLSA